MASVYSDILTAVKASLETVDGIGPVVIRTDLVKLDRDPATLTIVAPAVSKKRVCPKPQARQFQRGVWWDYPVIVAYYTPNSQLLGAETLAYVDMTEAIGYQLWQVQLEGVDSVFDTELENQELSKLAAVVGSNSRVKSWWVWYTVPAQLKASS